MKNYFLSFTLLFQAILLGGWMQTASAQIAQDTTKPAQANLALVLRSYQDSVWLRWAVSNEAVWKVANTQGYVVERAERPAGNTTPAAKLKFTPIAGSPFKNWTQEQWQTALAPLQADTQAYALAGVAANLALTPTTKPTGDIIQNIKTLTQARQNAENPFTLALLLANRSRVAALGLGLRTTDKGVKTGKTYVYRVYCAGKTPIATDTAYAETAVQAYSPEKIYSMLKVSAFEADSSIAFDWQKTPEFYGFQVERSRDGGKIFSRLTKMPIVPSFPEGYTGDRRAGFGDDEVGIPRYQPLVYRFWGSTPFADEVMFAEVRAMRRDRTPTLAPFIESAEHTQPTKVVIQWKMNAPVEADLQAFRIKRGSKADGTFTDITQSPLDKNTRTFTDTQFDLGGQNYYVVEAIDTAGNVSRSMSRYVTLIDSTPPAKPVFISGTMDSLGKVKLVIQPNMERDFAGYRLLKGNAREHEFSAIQQTYSDSLPPATKETPPVVFFDSTQVRTLTRSVFYRVIALDRNYNESELSEIIEIKRPDVIRPVAPLLGTYTATDSSVVLTYVRSASNDVAQHKLLRRVVSGKRSAWEAIATLSPKDITPISTYNDYAVQGGTRYEYAMIAIDESGLVSDTSLSITVTPYTRMFVSAPVLVAKAAPATRSVEIGWEYKSNITAAPVFVLMRQMGADGWRVISRTEGIPPTPTLKDNVPEGVKTPVVYMMKIVYPETGQESRYSAPVEVSMN